MSASIVDSLLVTLGLDPRQFTRGAAEANRAQRDMQTTAERTTRETDRIERRLSTERTRRNRDVEQANKRIADGVKRVRNEALALFTVFALGSGLKSFIGNTLNSAVQLGYLSTNLRMSTEDINAWQRASERAGGSREGIVRQLQESARDLAALRSGMGPSEGMQWFFRLGGSSADLKDGNTYLLARSKIIHELFQADPTKAALMAANMGISEEQFNLIKQGPAVILDLVDAQRKNSALTEKDSANALKLRNRLLDFKDSMQATATKILVALIPAFEELVGWLEKGTSWITANKDEIGKWVADLVTKAIPVLTNIGKAIADVDWKNASENARAFASAVMDIADAVRDVKEWWEKWQASDDKTGLVTNALGGTAIDNMTKIDAEREAKKKPADQRGVWEKQRDEAWGLGQEVFARTLASFGVTKAKEWIRDKTGKDDYQVGPAKAPGAGAGAGAGKVDQKTSNYIIGELMSMGWSKAQATGIAANLKAESGYNPAAVGDGGKAYGIAQWHPDRQRMFKAITGKDIRGSSLDDQLWFLNHELRDGNEQAAGRKLSKAQTESESAAIVSRAALRPKHADSEAAKRAAEAARMAAGAASVGVKPTARPSTSQTEVKVGAINVHTQATDAAGIARDIGGAINRTAFGFATQANTGVV